MKLLPKVPSKLLRIALEDLKKAEKSKNVEISMGNWMSKVGNFCEVCFAGSVMRGTFASETKKLISKEIQSEKTSWKKVQSISDHDFGRFDPDSVKVYLGPSDYGLHNQKCFFALDSFRRGHIGEALEILGIRLNAEQRKIVRYLTSIYHRMGIDKMGVDENYGDPYEFQWVMSLIATEFEKVGL